MPSFNPFSLPIVFLFLLSFLSLSAHAAGPLLISYTCANHSFAQNSVYPSRLNSLLSSLSSNATGNIEFYNTSVGETTSNPVYGLFLCRGDVAAEMCRRCVFNAVQALARQCSSEKVAVIWYDECMVRYSNESIFSILAKRPRLAWTNPTNVTEQDRFNRLVNTTMTELAREASNFPIGVKKFGVKEVKFSEFQNVYNLVQCTPDLSSTDCNSCLQFTINRLLIFYGERQGARGLLPSCNVRYEGYPFYNIVNILTTPAPAPVLAPPPPSSVAGSKGKNRISTATIVPIAVPVTGSVMLFILGYSCFLIRRKKYNAVEGEIDSNDMTSTVEFLQFDFATIEAATNKFSDDHNKLGEGGFGAVYKGILPNGQEIAVKRLLRNSRQGEEQFKNEVVLVAKLQHRNLTRLLGFCLDGEKKILVYEFVPYKSLDYFLYDPRKQEELDWSRRYNIIGGIARGIQYLHEDSRLRIIHRDLKANNVLLDANMNPKISDFGMARIFGINQTQGNISRVVGTYGYMSPEYAMHGEFSMKSDVYSFGVLILEIISGKKNNSFYESEDTEDLLSYVWMHWRDDRPLELLDPSLRDSYSRDEVLRCIQIGLLCVQEDPANRPTMASILLTLNNGSVTLPSPQEPAFFPRTDQSTSEATPWSVNEMSIIELQPR